MHLLKTTLISLGSSIPVLGLVITALILTCTKRPSGDAGTGGSQPSAAPAAAAGTSGKIPPPPTLPPPPTPTAHTRDWMGKPINSGLASASTQGERIGSKAAPKPGQAEPSDFIDELKSKIAPRRVEPINNKGD